MDANTARQEAIAFSTGPGQAITYQIGKLQIMKFLAEARLQQGEKFNLCAFHDFVWKNGNVPIALQRWEFIGGSERSSKIRGNDNIPSLARRKSRLSLNFASKFFLQLGKRNLDHGRPSMRAAVRQIALEQILN
jgi:hypothetical protein